jgi:hypothetical protein
VIDGVPISIRRIAKLFCQSETIDDPDDAMIAGYDLERLGWNINRLKQYIPPEALIFGWVHTYGHAFWFDLNRAQEQGKVENNCSTTVGSLIYQCWICCWAHNKGLPCARFLDYKENELVG